MPEPTAYTYREAALACPLPRADAHKYSRGYLLIAAGSERYPGAAVLAALSAPRVGAGYTRLMTPASAASAARCHLVSVPVTACKEDDGAFCPASVAEIVQELWRAHALLVGPGLGMSEAAETFLWAVLESEPAGSVGVVLDADALSVISRDPRRFMAARKGAPTVITPHEGEAARLLGHSIADRAQAVAELAERYGCTAVLKGPGTLVASGAGECRIHNGAGPELSKAGMGDVLAGMVAGLLAQGLSAFDAANLAVHLHGHAGAFAACELGIVSVIPEDVIGKIPEAIQYLEAHDVRLAKAALELRKRV